jgi:ANTAR domain
VPHPSSHAQPSLSAARTPWLDGRSSADGRSAEDGRGGHVNADGHADGEGPGRRTGEPGAPLIDVAALIAENEGLRQRLASQPVIEQAKGVLMGYYGVTADTAFQLLRRWSQDTNTKLRHIAELLINTTCTAGQGAAPHEVAQQVLASRLHPPQPNSTRPH